MLSYVRVVRNETIISLNENYNERYLNKKENYV
jgi:hypothetical protein